jgi:hypothetical protein
MLRKVVSASMRGSLETISDVEKRDQPGDVLTETAWISRFSFLHRSLHEVVS